MQKFIGQAIVIFLISSCSTAKNKEQEMTNPNETILVDFADKLNAEQLRFIKTTYGWDNEETLILNYSQPVSSCHFNNNRISNSGKKWWRNFYSKVNTGNSLIIKVLANGEKIRKKLDNKQYFDDKNDFLLDNFFSRRKSCYGVMVINEQGFYMQYNGHYSERQVNKYLELLSIQ